MREPRLQIVLSMLVLLVAPGDCASAEIYPQIR